MHATCAYGMCMHCTHTVCMQCMRNAIDLPFSEIPQSESRNLSTLKDKIYCHYLYQNRHNDVSKTFMMWIIFGKVFFLSWMSGLNVEKKEREDGFATSLVKSEKKNRFKTRTQIQSDIFLQRNLRLSRRNCKWKSEVNKIHQFQVRIFFSQHFFN